MTHQTPGNTEQVSGPPGQIYQSLVAHHEACLASYASLCREFDRKALLGDTMEWLRDSALLLARTTLTKALWETTIETMVEVLAAHAATVEDSFRMAFEATQTAHLSWKPEPSNLFHAACELERPMAWNSFYDDCIRDPVLGPVIERIDT